MGKLLSSKSHYLIITKNLNKYAKYYLANNSYN
jgi:hypothetical protein